LNFLDRFSKNPQVSTFTKIRPVGAELLLHADGLTDRHDDANTRFTQIFANAPKNAHSFYSYRYVCWPKLV